ncbi:DUF2304 domain-containing protein [Kineococcus indalonis]|uniref:DUF2304 domain-containing protein n=1 Tax=Kineococcus indalonis TaxID=2696566 RepID=UPI0014122351|nr:DUF2304 domain-containing protein [Kineococcus indalonis]NAZ86051.1 DUF2304 family protein [Kineococcus indalonis]
MLIQALLLVAFAVIGTLLVRDATDVRHQAVRRILIVLFGLFAAVSVLVPGSVSWVAERLGVGRGTDLVLYGTVVAFLGFVAASYRRMRALESRLVELTRRLALDEAREDELEVALRRSREGAGDEPGARPGEGARPGPGAERR